MSDKTNVKTAYCIVVEQFAQAQKDTLSKLLELGSVGYAVKMVPRITRALKGGLLDGAQFKTNAAGFIVIRADKKGDLISSFKGKDFQNAEKIGESLSSELLEYFPPLKDILDDVERERKKHVPTLPEELTKLIKDEFVKSKKDAVLSPLSHYMLLLNMLNCGKSDIQVKRYAKAAVEFKRNVYSKHLVKADIRGTSEGITKAICLALITECEKYRGDAAHKLADIWESEE